MKPDVNIVALKDGWILQRIAERLSSGLAYAEWTEKPTKLAKLTYYINYAQVVPERVSEIEAALFTHIERGVPELVDQWNFASNKLDVAVCMSEQYAKTIKGVKAQPIVISPGVDLTKFKQKPIVIGVNGTVKHTGRKREDIIKSVMDIEGIEWRFSGKGWPGKSKYYSDQDMPSFFNELDYLLVASTIEGGPIPAIEALATGVPVISADVGWMPELPHIKFKLGDASSLRKVLHGLVAERSKLREAVQDRTWDNFVTKHDILFKELLNILPKQVTTRDIKLAVKKAKVL